MRYAEKLDGDARRARRIFIGDLCDPGIIREAMRVCDTVIHLAAQAKVWLANPSYFERFNVDGTRTVAECGEEL